MFVRLALLLFLSFLSQKVSYAAQSEWNKVIDVIEAARLIHKNKVMFKSNILQTKKIRHAIWQDLIYFYSSSHKYCLQMRRVSQDREDLRMIKDQLHGDCQSNRIEPVAEITKINELELVADNKHLKGAFKSVEGKKVSINVFLLSNDKNLNGLTVGDHSETFPKELWSRPCATLKASCSSKGVDLCPLCPYGVRNVPEQSKCQNAQVFCREKSCGKTGEFACQRLLLKSNICEENLDAYSCKAGESFKLCREGKVVCL